MIKLRSTALCLVLCLSFSALANQSGSSPFRKAKEFYAKGQYDSTIVLIREHLKKNGKDPESVTLVPLVVEAYMRKENYAQAHRLINMYRQKYSDAAYMPRLNYLQAVAYAREENHSAALASFSKAMLEGLSDKLEKLTLSNAENICKRSLSIEELSKLSKDSGLYREILEIVQFFKIQKLMDSDQVVRARNNAEQFSKDFPRSRYSDQIKGVLSRSRQRQKNTIQIGMLAPLSGLDAQIGKRVMQGAKLAMEKYNARTPRNIKFIVYDTEGDMVEAAHKSKSLVLEDQVPVVIGPVLSATSTASASIFTGKDVLMISPTATEEGIADIGDNIFQMNNTVGALGSKIARYAVEKLNIREFAIIAPDNGYGMAMAEAFRDELRKHNIEVVHHEFFEDGIHDFRPHFMRLRKKLLARHLGKITAEQSGAKIVQVSHRDSARYSDSTLSVGGLFMPVEGEDVLKLAPQAVFHRIQTQMLGSSGWHDPKIPKEGKRYVQNAMISTGFEPDTKSKKWQEFAKAYKSQFNMDADKIAAMGYDAARLVIKAMEQTRGAEVSKLIHALRQVKNYKGLSGQISFDARSGANTEAAILKVTKKGFIRVQ
ncbi:MAG: penicillin-binding protein activator [Chitinispirillaceae bacterium]